LDCVPQDDNAFAEYGTFCHELLEAWATGEMLSFELSDAYTRLFDDMIRHSFPPFPIGMGQRYYDAGLAYFNGFNGFGDQYRILAVEDRFVLDVHGNPFVGVVDLVMEDPQGDLVVVDHKSKSAKAMRNQKDTYTRQLYLYATAVKTKFGQYPTRLAFNLFRDGDWMEEAFDTLKLHDTLGWVIETIQTILADKLWEARPSDYFCRFVCSSCTHCPIMK